MKLRTLDNTYVRIPNESMIKSEVTTLTRYAIRRLDLALSVPHGTDLGRVERVLLEVAAANPQCLMEPAPRLQINGLGGASVDLALLVWTAREHLLGVRTEVYRSIVARFATEGLDLHLPAAGLPSPQPPAIDSRR